MLREEASKEALQFPDAIRTSDALFGPDLSWVHVATLVVSTVRTVLCVFVFVFVCCACVRVARVCCACVRVARVCCACVRVARVCGTCVLCLLDGRAGRRLSCVSLMCQYLCCLVSSRFVHLCAFHVRVNVCICM